MSYELVAGDPIPPVPPASSREPWPEGQVYIAHDADATKKLWDEWSREDAYPLVFRQDLELKPEYKTLKEKEIINADKTVTHSSPRGRFVLPDGFHEYRPNGYARGGIAWSAAYIYAHRAHAGVLDPVLPDVVFNTSDFDTVECTICRKLPRPWFGVINQGLKYETEDGTQLVENVPEAWPGRWYGKFFTPLRLNRVTVDYGQEHGDNLSWKTLARFFDNKLTLNGVPLTHQSVDGQDHVGLVQKYNLDAVENTHEKGNLDSLPARYGLADAVPYLMRAKGFGFVETPTIQVGQLIDTLSDYDRCAAQNAVGIKAKYRRRLERLEHSWKVHVALFRAGYRHGPDSPSTTPFVLSTVVADELRGLVRSRAWQSFFRATNPDDNNNCRRAEVNEAKKEVVMREIVACDEDAARMNCKRMLGHPFKGRTKPKALESYATQDEWRVRLGESLHPTADPKRKFF